MSHDSPSPTAAAAAEAGAARPDDPWQALQRKEEEEEEVFYDASAEEQPPPPPPPPPPAGSHGHGTLELARALAEAEAEEEQEYDDEDDEDDDDDDPNTPGGVGRGSGGIISPSARPNEDPALANTLRGVCDVCELADCACGKVSARRGIAFELTPAETKRAGKPHLPHKPHRAIAPVGGRRPPNKDDYRAHHRPPHRDPHHASVASRDADFVGDVPQGKDAGEAAAGASGASAFKAPPVSAIDAEVQPPVVPPPGLKGRPSRVGGERIAALESARDPFERAGAPSSSAAGAGGRGRVAGHKHRGLHHHEEFSTLG
jgi:hypothetical protein